MTQVVILEKFVTYLQQTWREDVAKYEAEFSAAPAIDQAKFDAVKETMQMRADYIKKLEIIFKKEECFGFAVCDGAMALTGKLEWWEDALLHIYQWDGDISALDEPIHLKNATLGRTTTLRNIFELAINYIVHSHGRNEGVVGDFFMEGVLQVNAMMPASSHFEMVDQDGSVTTIQQNKRVAGHFTKDQLRLLMDENTFQRCICLLGKFNHVIRVAYLGNDIWQLYDPDAPLTDASTFHVEGSKDTIIDMIFACLGTHDISLEVAAISKEEKINLSAYDDLLRERPSSLLTPGGIFMMIRQTPDRVNELFELADKPSHAALLRPLIVTLAEDDSYAAYSDGRNFLHMLAAYASFALPALFALADDTSDGKALQSVIAKKLLEKQNQISATPLHLMAVEPPQAINAIFKLASRSTDMINALGEIVMFTLTDTFANYTLLDLLAEYNPTVLPDLFSLARTHQHAAPLRLALAKMLREQDKDQELRLKNILHVLIAAKTVSMITIFDLVLSDSGEPRNLRFLLQALAARSQGKSGWQMLSEKQQQALLAAVSRHLELMNSPSLIEFAREMNRALTDDRSVFRGLCNDTHTLFQPHYAKTTIWQHLIEKTQSILSKREDQLQNPVVQEILRIKIK